MGLSLRQGLIFLHLYLFVDLGHRDLDISRHCLTGSGVDSSLSEVSLGRTPVDGVQEMGGIPAGRQSAGCRDEEHPGWGRVGRPLGKMGCALGRRVRDRLQIEAHVSGYQECPRGSRMPGPEVWGSTG